MIKLHCQSNTALAQCAISNKIQVFCLCISFIFLQLTSFLKKCVSLTPWCATVKILDSVHKAPWEDVFNHDRLQFHRRQQLLLLCVLCAALSLDDQTGNFEVGKDFDALRVNVAVPGGPIDLIEQDGPKVGGGTLS